MIERIKQKISESKEACNYNPLTRVIPVADILEIMEQEKEKPKTNADRIRNMTDEELAEFLDIVGEDGISSQYVDIPCNCCREKTECSKCWKDWLQSKAE